MPTYQYACTACEHRLEAVQKFTDDALTECPECAGALRKVFSAVGVVFKGSGFYRTDSRAKQGEDTSASGKRKDSSAEQKSSADSSTGSSASAKPKESAAATASASSGSSAERSGGSSAA